MSNGHDMVNEGGPQNDVQEEIDALRELVEQLAAEVNDLKNEFDNYRFNDE